MGLINLILIGALFSPCDAPAQPEVDVVSDREIAIPIQFDPKQKAEIKEMIQYVSRDGKRWEQYAVTKPTQNSVTYKAPEDGQYWFQMVIVDQKGNRSPEDHTKPEAAAAAKRITVDTKPPIINIRSAEKVGNDVTVSWEIQEENPDLTKFSLEYKGADGVWYPIQDIKPLLSSSARFQISTNEKLSVRVRLTDLAGNPGEQVKDVAGSGGSVSATTVSLSNTGDSKTPVNLIPNNKLSLPGEGGPSLKELAPPVNSIPAMPIATPLDLPTKTDYSPVGSVGPTANANAAPLGSNTLAPLKTPNAGYTGAPIPTAQIMNISKFDLGYEVEGTGASGVSRAELWVTRDDGKTWLRWAISDKVDGKFPVNLEKIENRTNPLVEGMYGFKIVLASGAGLTKGAPLSGEIPEIRVDVDTTPPVLKLFEPLPDPNQRHTMILKWHAADRNLAAEPITIEWSKNADGPWTSVAADTTNDELITTSSVIPIAQAKRMANTGSYAWKLPANFPHDKIYLRICARDTAGNIAEVKTPEAVLIDQSRPNARIIGIVGTSASDKR